MGVGSLILREYIRTLLEISRVDPDIVGMIRDAIKKSEFWKYDNYINSKRTKTSDSQGLGERKLTAAAQKLESALSWVARDISKHTHEGLLYLAVRSFQGSGITKHDISWSSGAAFSPPNKLGQERGIEGVVFINLNVFRDVPSRYRESQHQEILDSLDVDTMIQKIMDNIEHELTHHYQWKQSDIEIKRISGSKRRKYDPDREEVDAYYADPDEIDAYARDSARDLLRMHGLNGGIEILRNTVNKEDMGINSWEKKWRGVLPSGMVQYLDRMDPDNMALGGRDVSKMDKDDSWDQFYIRQWQKRNRERLLIWKRFLKRTYQHMQELASAA